jgi:chitin disaccharide deacetylase
MPTVPLPLRARWPSSSRAGAEAMLIVNADDLGRSPTETDMVLECHARGRVTAASAMVFMVDSERAAGLARDAGIPVGLHLNLSESFSGVDVPAGLRRRHERVCRFLKASRFALLLFNPLLADDFARVVAAQFAEFRRLYGADPAHVDGHQHMHLATNVLVQRLLPEGARVRRNFTFGPGQKGALNRWYRARVDRALARRHRMSDHFFSLTQQLRAGHFDAVLALARRNEVELMVHPAWAHEHAFLMSDEFGRAIQGAASAAERRS